MIALNVTGLKKSFGKTEVLKGIDFSVNKGEVLVILGSSGGGKTTLLRCLNFLEIPQEGTISVNGETIFDASDKKEISEDKIKKNRLHFGLVFQQFNLFPQYNVLRNVTLAPSLLKKGSDEEIEKKAKELIKKVGLSDKENNYPCELSGGQQQRSPRHSESSRYGSRYIVFRRAYFRFGPRTHGGSFESHKIA